MKSREFIGSSIASIFRVDNRMKITAQDIQESLARSPEELKLIRENLRFHETPRPLRSSFYWRARSRPPQRFRKISIQ